jgi:hypothetical protein
MASFGAGAGAEGPALERCRCRRRCWSGSCAGAGSAGAEAGLDTGHLGNCAGDRGRSTSPRGGRQPVSGRCKRGVLSQLRPRISDDGRERRAGQRVHARASHGMARAAHKPIRLSIAADPRWVWQRSTRAAHGLCRRAAIPRYPSGWVPRSKRPTNARLNQGRNHYDSLSSAAVAHSLASA